MIKKCAICGCDYKVKPSNYEKSKYCSRNCMSKAQIKNIYGLKFNKLTVIEYCGQKKNYALWRCKCDCGKEVFATGSNLICGNVKSCGCVKKELDNMFGNIYKQKVKDILKIAELTNQHEDKGE